MILKTRAIFNSSHLSRILHFSGYLLGSSEDWFEHPGKVWKKIAPSLLYKKVRQTIGKVTIH
jgi:hypothetical protein